MVFKNKIKDIRMAKINSPKMLSGENTPIQMVCEGEKSVKVTWACVKEKGWCVKVM